MRFFIAIGGLSVSFAAAIYSTVFRQEGNFYATAFAASFALISSVLVGMATVPYLARRVKLRRFRERFHYDFTREGMAYIVVVLVIGVAGVFSFYPAKVLGALGDGGAVITDDDATARALGELRDHGRDKDTGEVVRWGRNTRLDNLQAAVLRVKLRHVNEEIARRRELARRYTRNLGDVQEVVLPPPPDVAPGDPHVDVFQNYEIEAERRDNLRAFLGERGVGTLLQWGGKGVHQFPALGIAQRLPRTEAILARSLMLPMNTSLTEDEVDYVSEQIREFYATR